MNQTLDVADNGNAAFFPTTRWSIILDSTSGLEEPDGPNAAMEHLAQNYRPSLRRFLLQRGYDQDAADEAVQGFFEHLLQRDFLRGVRPRESRFRTFLLRCFTHWLTDRWRRETAEKRGGGTRLEPLEELGDRLSGELPEPDESFDRAWAATLVENGRNRLRDDYYQQGKSQLFDALQPILPGAGSQDAQPYAEIAGDLDLSLSSVKKAAERLRTDFGRLLRQEVADTVRDPADIDAELRYLIELLRR